MYVFRPRSSTRLMQQVIRHKVYRKQRALGSVESAVDDSCFHFCQFRFLIQRAPSCVILQVPCPIQYTLLIVFYSLHVVSLSFLLLQGIVSLILNVFSTIRSKKRELRNRFAHQWICVPSLLFLILCSVIYFTFCLVCRYGFGFWLLCNN